MPDKPDQIRILLAEDSALTRRIEITALKSIGYENVLEAEDGDEAIEKLESGVKIDLVLSDWNMPNRGGLDLLKWIRSNEQFKSLPFIMATGQGDMAQEQAAREAGVSAFVAKPFNADELRTKIEISLGQKEEEKPSEHGRQAEITESGKIKLNIAHIQITDHLILGVAKHMIKNRMVEPKHFELETHCMPGWNPVRDALEKGAVDGACILAPIAMDLFGFGAPISLTLLAHKNGSVMVRRKKGEYKEPYKDFFADRSFLIPHKMSIHHMLSHLFFSRIGLTAGMIVQDQTFDVNFEVVAPVDMPGFLKDNKEMSGFMVAEPIATKTVASGVADLQFLSSQIWDNHPCCVLAMRRELLDPHEEALQEFHEVLVAAGKFIAEKPEISAQIAVDFLDPRKKVGLKPAVLKNVLTDPQGIKTNDLYPVIDELEIIQQYMVNDMGIGKLIDLDDFVDLRFAKKACKQMAGRRSTKPVFSLDLVKPRKLEKGESDKSMLAREGKYLTFALQNQEFGVDILKIKEIIGMMPIRPFPQAPNFIKGVINLRHQVIPVMDLRLRFGMEMKEYTDRTCIVVLEIMAAGKKILMGVVVDSVSEVMDIGANQIEDTPSFGARINTDFLLGMAKIKGGVKLLLDIDNVLDVHEQAMASSVVKAAE